VTDRPTNVQTDTGRQQRPRYAERRAGKNRITNFINKGTFISKLQIAYDSMAKLQIT